MAWVGWRVVCAGAEVYRVIGKASSHHLPFIIKAEQEQLSIAPKLSGFFCRFLLLWTVEYAKGIVSLICYFLCFLESSSFLSFKVVVMLLPPSSVTNASRKVVAVAMVPARHSQPTNRQLFWKTYPGYI